MMKGAKQKRRYVFAHISRRLFGKKSDPNERASAGGGRGRRRERAGTHTHARSLAPTRTYCTHTHTRARTSARTRTRTRSNACTHERFTAGAADTRAWAECSGCVQGLRGAAASRRLLCRRTPTCVCVRARTRAQVAPPSTSWARARGRGRARRSPGCPPCSAASSGRRPAAGWRCSGACKGGGRKRAPARTHTHARARACARENVVLVVRTAFARMRARARVVRSCERARVRTPSHTCARAYLSLSHASQSARVSHTCSTSKTRGAVSRSSNDTRPLRPRMCASRSPHTARNSSVRSGRTTLYLCGRARARVCVCACACVCARICA